MREQGRSMVEMLGVLAIIGVLSVGAIAGYQKAMYKYKLKKQAESLSHLFYVMTQYKNEWVFGSTDLMPYYRKLGEIPEDMIKKGALYDSFNNPIRLQTNNCPSDGGICTGTILRYHIGKQDNYDICHNLLKIGIAYAPHLLDFISYNYDSEGQISYASHFVGDKYCTGNTKCLVNMTMDDIYNICKSCPAENNCTFNFLWKRD